MNKIQKQELVSIIFPIFNGGQQPFECIKSILEINYPKSKIEIVVIDNGSTDGSETKIKQKYPCIKLVTQKVNSGFSKAVNKGIALSSGKYIMIANDDTLFSKTCIQHLVNYAQSNPDTGILGGKIYSKNNPDKISSTGFMMDKWTGNIYNASDNNRIFNPDWIQGCALFATKKLFNSIGYLDTEFNHFFEDFDLCIRAKKAGYHIVYLPQVVFWHGESTTANKNKPDKYFKWYCSKYRFILKNLPFINIFSIFCLQFFLIMPFRTIILRDGRFMPFLKATWWSIKNLPSNLSARFQQ